MRSYFFTMLIFLSALQVSAISLDDLEESDEQEDGTPPIAVEWSGLLDLRFAYHGSDVNWADAQGSYGGRGLSRYGSKRGTGEYGLGFELGQISLVSDILFFGETTAHIQLNVSDHSDEGEGHGGIGVVEAFVEEKFEENNLSLRFGFLIPPVSLEHPNVAWSTNYSITPSAINTWMGEEIRALGLEGKYKVLPWMEATFALFSHNDSSGTMLTYRGWALHDYQGTYGARLRWNSVAETSLANTSNWVRPFVEQDDRLGHYEKLSFFNKNRSLKLELFYSDNRADPSAFDGTNYGWRTRFGNISLEYHSPIGLSFLGQYMTGSTRMGAQQVVDADYTAYYALLTYLRDKHRITVRYDNFEVEDVDGQDGTNVTDDASKGTAYTFAYIYRLNDNKTLALEALLIDSQRNGNEGHGNGDPSDDLIQLMYRFTF